MHTDTQYLQNYIEKRMNINCWGRAQMRLRRGTKVLLNLFLNAFNFFNKHTLVNCEYNLSKCKTESIRFFFF